MNVFPGLLAGWLVLGVVVDAGLYRVQCRYLAAGAADSTARGEGERRAGLRLAGQVRATGLALLAVVFAWGTGLLAGERAAVPAGLCLVLAVAGDQVLRALVAPGRQRQGRLAAQLRQFAGLLPLGAALWGVAVVSPDVLVPWLWAAGWLVLAGVWRAYQSLSPAGEAPGGALTDTALVERLRDLAAACGRPRCAITVADQPPLAEQVGARVEARGHGGRIVLTQGLVDRLSASAIVAVVAHEFGHACLGHLMRFDGLRAALVAVYMVLVASGLMATTLDASAPVVLWLIYVTITPAAWAVRPVLNGYRRGCEFAADAFAAGHVGRRRLADTLADLFSINPHRAGLHPWYRFFNATHPLDNARLDRLYEHPR
ncbi:MAG: hypothetical protein CMP08_06175 [Xanthomonadales bacterium]|nr:hypothetical protein [Xanthomonadales bacterium]